DGLAGIKHLQRAITVERCPDSFGATDPAATEMTLNFHVTWKGAGCDDALLILGNPRSGWDREAGERDALSREKPGQSTVGMKVDPTLAAGAPGHDRVRPDAPDHVSVVLN